jgi:uncharacterized protein Veg
MEDKIYTPKTILDAYRQVPGKGRTIKISYIKGQNNKNRITRQAVIIQKTPSFVVVEMTAQTKDGKRGQYRVSFQYVDLITKRVVII